MTTIATKYPFVGFIESRIGGRHENQDCAGFVDTALGLLLVVCDGAGGGPGGRTASHLAVETMLNELANVAEHTSRHDALKYGIEKANDAIYGHAMQTPELRGMATTIVAMIINEQSALIAHVGDSRIYLLRKENIIFRSNDHSVVAEQVRKGQLTEEQARCSPQSNRITRALGNKPAVEPEYDEVAFRRGDRFVLCTDGIWGAMPQPELVKALSRPMGISELVAELAAQVDQIGVQGGGGHDNLTLAILDPTFQSEQKRKATRPKWLFPLLTLLSAAIVGTLVYYVTSRHHTDDSIPSDPVQELPIDRNRNSQDRQPDNVDPVNTQPSETAADVVPQPTAPTVGTSPDANAAPPNANAAPPAHNGAPSASAVSSATGMQESNGSLSASFQEHSKAAEVKGRVDTVLGLLGKLKTMKGGTRRELTRRKRAYINSEILPRVEGLIQLIPSNMQELKKIREMLDKEQASRAATNYLGRGVPDRECNDLIDQVINKLKILQQ